MHIHRRLLGKDRPLTSTVWVCPAPRDCPPSWLATLPSSPAASGVWAFPSLPAHNCRPHSSGDNLFPLLSGCHCWAGPPWSPGDWKGERREGSLWGHSPTFFHVHFTAEGASLIASTPLLISHLWGDLSLFSLVRSLPISWPKDLGRCIILVLPREDLYFIITAKIHICLSLQR